MTRRRTSRATQSRREKLPTPAAGSLDPRGGGRRGWAVAVLLLALGFAVYGNSLGNAFVLDDHHVILGDPRVGEGRIGELISGEYWPGPRGNLLYRPLTMVSFAVNWAVSHEAWAFRLVNLLLHVGVGFVLFLLARDWTKSVGVALIAACVFIVHPIHTAPLNAIVDRAELGAALFGLLAVWLWWRDGVYRCAVGATGGLTARAGTGSKLPVAPASQRVVVSDGARGSGHDGTKEARKQSSRRGHWVGPVAAAVSFATATLFKENALTLVGVVILLDLFYWKAGERGARAGWFGRRIRRCYVPLLIVVVAYLGARWGALGTIARPPAVVAVVDNPIAHPAYDLQPGDSRFLARWGTPVSVFGKAAGLMVRPHPLSWDYSYASIETVKRLRDPGLLLGVVWLLVMAWAMAASYRRARHVFIALGLSLITYSIVSNTFIVIGTIFAERYLYLPSVGFCLLVGILAGGCIGALRTGAGAVRRAAAGGFLVAIAAGAGWCAWATVDRNRDWRSDQALNAADLKTHPQSSRLWCSAAIDALNAKDMQTAADKAERAISICREFVTAWRVAGLAHWQRGSHDLALHRLKTFFELGGADDEEAVVAVANILRTRGDHQASISLLAEFVARRPREATARNNLAWYLITAEPAGLRDAATALRHAKSAIRLAPGQGDFVDTYISVLIELNRRDEVVRELRRLLPTLGEADPYRGPLARKLVELQGP